MTDYRNPEDDSRLSEPFNDEPCHTLTLQEQAKSDNIAAHIGKSNLRKIGDDLLQNFKYDLESREQLDENLKSEVELILQIAHRKTTPWEGASNVKFPLATIAVLQYMARAQAAIYNNGRLVEARLPSNADKRDPIKAEACKAVEKDMAFELFNKVHNWDEGMRKTFIAQATSGNVYKKIYFNSTKRRVQSDVVFADKLVFNCKSHTLDTAPRISEITEYTRNDQFSHKVTGAWVEMPQYNHDQPDQLTLVEETINHRHGIEQSQLTEVDPCQFIEVYTWYDLDGDGYQEPIICTIRRGDGAVARIVANFSLEDIHYNKEGNLVSIDREVTFIKYGFIPSPNDSIYDFGFGRLLYSLNSAINTATNQILDISKWKANGGAGFVDQRLGSQIAGKNKFMPGEYKQAKIMDIDMNKAIWSVPIPDVPPELMAMIQFLVSYADRVSGATEARSGENPGQNTKVGTVEAIIEEGAAIFNGCYRATRQSFCQEMRALFRLKKRYFDFIDRSKEEEEIASKSQYDQVIDIDPACALQYVSERDRMKKASIALQTASAFPNAHNIYEILKDFYDAQDPDTAERYLIHDPKSPTGIPQGQDPQIAIEQQRLQLKSQEIAQKGQAIAQKSQETQTNVQFQQQKLQLDAAKAQADIELTKAQAIQTISSIEDAKIGHKIALLDAIIGLGKHGDQHALNVLSTVGEIHAKRNQQERDSGLDTGTDNTETTGETGAADIPQETRSHTGAFD